MNRDLKTRRSLLCLAGLCALPLPVLAAQESTLAKIRREGFIRVGFANEAPFSYADSSGRLTGESPAVFRHVMKELGVAQVDGVLTEWGALIPGLRAGRFDAIVASMYITPKRCKQILFANPTYGVGEALIVRKGNPDRLHTYADAIAAGKKIAFIAGTAEIGHARLAGLGAGQQLIVPDFAAAVAAVKSSRVSAAALTALTAGDLAAKDAAIERARPFTFAHAGKTYRGEGSFGFRLQDTSLRDAVNEQLKRFIGSEQHLAMIAPFGFDRSNLPELSAEQHCAGN
jgi:polar amino acid transport system substrate-binding protein